MSAPPWAHKAKVCIRCKRDCSSIPRTKNPQGQYMCRECYDREALGLDRAAAPPTSGPGPAEPPASSDSLSPDAGLPLESIINSGEGLGARIGEDIGIEPDAALDAPPRSAHAGVNVPRDPRMCAYCGMILHDNAVICTQCGMNSTTGLFLTGKPASAPDACAKCGYDLRGLKSPRCPECGTINTVSRRRARQAPAKTAREYYLRPAVYGVMGIVVGVATSWLTKDSDEALLFLERFAAGAVSCIVGYFICAAIWVGLEEPAPVLAARVAASWAVAHGSAVLVQQIPLTFVLPYVVAVAVLYLMLMDLFDHDTQDAALISLVCAACYIVVRIALHKYLQ